MVTRRRRRDDALFTLPAARKGRVEVALDRAIAAARAGKSLSALDAAIVTLARAQARGVDAAESSRDTWALAAIGRELRETLIRMRLDPASRGVGADGLAEFLAALSSPDPPHPPGSAVGDTPDPGPG